MKCVRCKLEINEKKDKYMSISDFNKKKRIKEVFMHITCWKNFFMEGIQKELRNKVGQVMRMVGQ